MRKIIILAVSSIFILSACNNQSVITEAKIEETTKETVIETTVEETTTIQETTKEVDKEQAKIKEYTKIITSKTYNELKQEYGWDKYYEMASFLESKGWYSIGRMSEKAEVLNYDDAYKKVEYIEKGNAGEIEGFVPLYSEEGYKEGIVQTDEIKVMEEKVREEMRAKKEQKTNEQAQSMVIRLSTPKTVDQIGGNKVGDNDGSYKGEFRQEPRLYGNEVFPGSMLVAVNGLFGDENTAQQYYECRNGFVILKNAGYKFKNELLRTDRTKGSLFDKVELEVFKLNNPNAKIINSSSNDYYRKWNMELGLTMVFLCG